MSLNKETKSNLTLRCKIKEEKKKQIPAILFTSSIKVSETDLQYLIFVPQNVPMVISLLKMGRGCGHSFVIDLSQFRTIK